MNSQIDPFTLKSILCTCGNEYFTQVIVLKEVPSVMSPTGQSMEYAVQLLKCTKCDEIRYPDGVEEATIIH